MQEKLIRSVYQESKGKVTETKVLNLNKKLLSLLERVATISLYLITGLTG